MLSAYGPEWIWNSEIIFSAKWSLRRLYLADGTATERLPFVGEDGLMPAVSPPQPGRRYRLVYVAEFHRHEHPADRDLGARCASILATCCRDLRSGGRDHFAQMAAEVKR